MDVPTAIEPLTSARYRHPRGAPPLPVLHDLVPRATLQIRPSWRRFTGPTRAQRLERLARLDQNRRVACRGLVSAHDDIDIERVELDAATDAAGRLGGDEGRAGAEERVDDSAAAVGEVEKSILEHGAE